MKITNDDRKKKQSRTKKHYATIPINYSLPYEDVKAEEELLVKDDEI